MVILPKILLGAEMGDLEDAGCPAKLVMAVQAGALSPLQARKVMALARRKASPGQAPAALYRPKTGAALIVMEADDVAELLDEGSG